MRRLLGLDPDAGRSTMPPLKTITLGNHTSDQQNACPADVDTDGAVPDSGGGY